MTEVRVPWLVRSYRELKRRRVLGAAAAYVVLAGVLIQLSDAIFEALLLPPWASRLLTVLLILGFPVVVVLAWFFDVSAGGLSRTDAMVPAGATEALGTGGQHGDLAAAFRRSHAAPVPDASLRGGAASAPEGVGRLLVVDDNETNRDLISRQLARQGYTIATASDGREALRLLEQGAFDLILLDVIMPVMDRVETLGRIRDQEALRDTPVIMLSSLDETDSALRCLELGASDYISKPIQPSLLEARIACRVALPGGRADGAVPAPVAPSR